MSRRIGGRERTVKEDVNLLFFEQWELELQCSKNKRVTV